MTPNEVRLEKLYSALSDYQVTVQELACRLNDVAQDISLLLEDTEQKIDEERYNG